MATVAIHVNNNINNDGSTHEDSNALAATPSAGKAHNSETTAVIVHNCITNNARDGSNALAASSSTGKAHKSKMTAARTTQESDIVINHNKARGSNVNIMINNNDANRTRTHCSNTTAMGTARVDAEAWILVPRQRKKSPANRAAASDVTAIKVTASSDALLMATAAASDEVGANSDATVESSIPKEQTDNAVINPETAAININNNDAREGSNALATAGTAKAGSTREGSNAMDTAVAAANAYAPSWNNANANTATVAPAKARTAATVATAKTRTASIELVKARTNDPQTDT